MQLRELKRVFLALALALCAPLAAAQFQPGMTLAAAEAQVKARMAAGASAAQIAKEAQAAKVDASVMPATVMAREAAGVATAIASRGRRRCISSRMRPASRTL